MGVESGRRGTLPRSEKLGGGRPPNPVSFPIFMVFWGMSTTLPTIRPPTKKSVATPLRVRDGTQEGVGKRQEGRCRGGTQVQCVFSHVSQSELDK